MSCIEKPEDIEDRFRYAVLNNVFAAQIPHLSRTIGEVPALKLVVYELTQVCAKMGRDADIGAAMRSAIEGPFGG